MNSFTALADSTRRDIVSMLARKGELTAGEICKRFEMTAPAISQHLNVLKEARLVRMRKDAQRRIYSLNEAGISEIETWVAEVKAIWHERFDALDDYLQKLQGKEKRNVRRRKNQREQG